MAKKIAPKKVVSKTVQSKAKKRHLTIKKSLGKVYNYFDLSNVSNAEDLKKQYYKLAMKLHPDKEGGDLVKFQIMQNEYDELSNSILLGLNLTNEQLKNEIVIDEIFKEALNSIINLDGITIEIIGTWIWVGGNTFPVHSILKKANFEFRKKKINDVVVAFWTLDVTGKGSANRGKGLEMDKIRSKYGSKNIKTGGKTINGIKLNTTKFESTLKKLTLLLKKRAKYLDKIKKVKL